jgi:steroid 5-alpha reductase family enzyme
VSFPTRDLLLTLPLTALAVAVVLGITLRVALRVGKHAVVDVAWGLGFAVIASVSYAVSIAFDEGDPGRRLLVAALTVIWGLRLATHIGLRSRGHGEDPRYEALLDKAPGNRTAYAVRKIYLTQGAVMWFVSLPVQVAVFQPQGLGLAGFGVLVWIGVALWAVGLFFETVGDLQLTRFRGDPASKGKVLDTGLWRYTRHPNYFGDACVWWGISLVAFSAWPGILTIISPVFMTFLLAKGTGKPTLEKDMDKRRPGYADYVRSTSGFIPLPPRKPSDTTSVPRHRKADT